MNMKKFAAILLALTMVLALCACSSTTTTPETTDPIATPNTGNTTPVGYLFTYNDYQFGVDMIADDVLKNLGEPKDEYTSESCAFGGEDTVYYYSSIQVSTNNEYGYERIYSIYLEDDLVSTEEGICVGSTADDVKAAYGEPGDKSTAACLIYEKDGMTLNFNLTDGVVSTILYNDI
jgi:hypothetical protein